MTKPKWAGGRVSTGRTYSFPDQPDREFPSVTNVIGQLDKPALRSWAAKEVATYAVQHRDVWGDLPSADAIDLLKRSPYRNSGSAADRGTAVHQAIEEDVDPDRLPSELAGYVRAARSFIEDMQDVDTQVFDEVTLRHSEHGYAGTADRLCWIGGEFTVVDWKTSKSIGYIEHALQLVALGMADEVVLADGTVRPMRFGPSQGIVVRLAVDGAWEARRLDLTSPAARTLFDGFVGLLAMKAADNVWGRWGCWEAS